MRDILEVPVGVRTRARILKLIAVILAIIAVVSLITYVLACGYIPHFYIITTTSMVPTLKPGDLVIVQHVNPDKIKVGDIIAFNVVVYDLYNPVPVSLGFTVTHRVVDIVKYDNETYFVTKGDNNPNTDPWYVPARYVLGVVHKVASLGPLGLMLASQRGRAIVLAFIILIILVAYYLYDTQKMDKKLAV